jgi:FkbM family methyltransferase
MSIKTYFGSHFHSISTIYHFLTALGDTILPEKKSYSEFAQEDIVVNEILSSYETHKGVYVDVGCNHPTRISNTYKFYRNGNRGILFDPNREMTWLNRVFRKRDIVITSGCSNENAVVEFFVSQGHPLSTCRRGKLQNIIGVKFITVYRLDDALKHIGGDFIFFLSVDVEGLCMEVLEGASSTLDKTLVACIEKDTDPDIINKFMAERNFEPVKTVGYNMIFKNKNVEKFSIYRK